MTKTESLLIDSLTSNKVQPPDRTNAKKLIELVHSIRKNGVMQPILVALIAGVYVIIDGHRRAAVWQALGNATIT